MRLGMNKDENESLFTKKINGKVTLKENRPILLISSTSWTKDEAILLFIGPLFKPCYRTLAFF